MFETLCGSVKTTALRDRRLNCQKHHLSPPLDILHMGTIASIFSCLITYFVKCAQTQTQSCVQVQMADVAINNSCENKKIYTKTSYNIQTRSKLCCLRSKWSFTTSIRNSVSRTYDTPMFLYVYAFFESSF